MGKPVMWSGLLLLLGSTAAAAEEQDFGIVCDVEGCVVVENPTQYIRHREAAIQAQQEADREAAAIRVTEPVTATPERAPDVVDESLATADFGGDDDIGWDDWGGGGGVMVSDPIEGINRGVYSFNRTLDSYLLRPTASGYGSVLPGPVKSAVHNFFNNLHYPGVVMNSFLQGKVQNGLQDTARFLINTTAGIGGLFDIASMLELPVHNEDFGQTFAVWGLGDGAYLMLPLFGPSNVRDTFGLVLDLLLDPLFFIRDDTTRWSLAALDTVDTRYQLLDAGDILDTSAVDPYAFVRRVHAQRRKALIENSEDQFDDRSTWTPNPGSM